MDKRSWIIEYWNIDTKQVECFSSDDGSWIDAPSNNIIYVYIRKHGKRPYSSPDKIYVVKVNGNDYYFWYRIDDAIVYGGWNDNNTGNMYTWHDDGYIEHHVLNGKPEGLDEKIIKYGVLVEEPYAKRLGLSWSPNSASLPQFKRSIKGCCNDG